MVPRPLIALRKFMASTFAASRKMFSIISWYALLASPKKLKHSSAICPISVMP